MRREAASVSWAFSAIADFAKAVDAGSLDRARLGDQAALLDSGGGFARSSVQQLRHRTVP